MNDCCCSVDPESVPNFVNEWIVQKSRKNYICCECKQPIPKGSQYEKVVGKWEGKISTFRTCIICTKIRQDFCPCGWEYGGLKETIWECLGFNYVTGGCNE